MTDVSLDRTRNPISIATRHLDFFRDITELVPSSDISDGNCIADNRITMKPIAADCWDTVATAFDGVSQEQTFAFGRSRWPSMSQEARIFRQNGRMIGGVLIRIQALPFRLGSVAICKWGPIHCDEAHPQAPERYASMIDALIAEYANERGMMLSILPRADAGNSQFEYHVLAARGFRSGAQVPYPNRYLVALDLPDAEHRRRLHHKWRYHLSRSEKAGLSFEHAGRERLGDFERLYASMTDRKRFPDHSAYESLPALMTSRATPLPELFLVRSSDGEIIAGAIIFVTGKTASYLYGATTAAALPLRAGYFMHWKIVQWLKDHSQATRYDLGGSDGFNGLHQFKSGFVGDAGAVVDLPPMMNFAAQPIPRLIGSSALAAHDLWRSASQKLRTIGGREAAPDLPRRA